MRRVTLFQGIASPSQRSSTLSAALTALPAAHTAPAGAQYTDGQSHHRASRRTSNSPGSAYNACERTNTVLITEGQPDILSAGLPSRSCRGREARGQGQRRKMATRVNCTSCVSFTGSTVTINHQNEHYPCRAFETSSVLARLHAKQGIAASG